MKPKKLIFCVSIVLFQISNHAQALKSASVDNVIDYISAFKDTLSSLVETSDNEFFKLSCNSLLSVINSSSSYTSADSGFILATYNAFNNLSDASNAKQLSTYLKRERAFIISWVSPTDGAVSFARLKPPKDWDPQLEYPVYIQLHGLTAPANSIIEYATKSFRDAPSSSFSYEDGYMLSPWGRGNLWYQGISETDIWECLAFCEQTVKVDQSRKYITGHSMGGYGAWRIASTSPNVWAGLGVHAGALWYDNSNLVNEYIANILKDLPTYFVCGTSDGLLGINQSAYNLLGTVGNENINFVTFQGGHEFVEENVQNMYLWLKDFVNEDWNSDIIEISGINQNTIYCYPNPASDKASITAHFLINSAINISIYDVYGRLIDEVVKAKDVIGEYTATYDLSQLSTGIYLIRLKSGQTVSETKLIVTK